MDLKRARPAPARTVLLATLLLVALLAGCTHDPNGNGNGAPGDPDPDPADPLWQNPYSFGLHFDGERAYQDLLAQVYEDPENLEGHRYRIPGTETHETVAHELYAKLQDPLETIGGQVAFQNFTGQDYYMLDLDPVSRFLCADDDEPGQNARERVKEISFMNIVARTNATHHGFIIGAHWDTKRFADDDPDPALHSQPVLGADDGASGTAAVIELARAFAASGVDLPLTFILFDGEDGFDRRDCHPLAGSLHYAQNLDEDERDTIDGMILLDMVGNQSAQYYREGHSRCYPFGECDVDSRWLLDHVWTTASEMHVDAFVDSPSGAIHDDHIPFLHQGIYAIDIINYGPHHNHQFPPYWHTTFDDHTAVHPDGLEQVGVVVEAALRLFDEDPTRIGPADDDA